MFSAVKTNIFRNGSYRFTKDRNFAIKPTAISGYLPDFQTTSNSLYIKNDYTIDPNSALAKLINNGFIVKINEVEIIIKQSGLDFPTRYGEYKFHRNLLDERKYVNGSPINDKKKQISINENDCLKFGECLTFASQIPDMSKFNELLKADTNPPFLQSGITEIPFGETGEHKDNVKIIKGIKLPNKNNYAVPQNGESYAIVRKQEIEGKSDYHIAFVLYTDAGVNITLEAEADNGNTYIPKFCFYDINPDGYTFHRRWSAELYKDKTDPDSVERYNSLYNNAETIVLKSRNIQDVLQEIDAENASKTHVQIAPPSSKRARIRGGKTKKSNKSNKSKIKKIKNSSKKKK